MDNSRSLLTLSIAASNAAPISNNDTFYKHRRLSSTGKSRRRLTDARDAATRPSYVFSLFPSVLSITSHRTDYPSL